MMPEAGGDYVYLRRAYGKAVGFLYGWMTFAVAKAGSQAALAVGLAIFMNVAVGGCIGTLAARGRPVWLSPGREWLDVGRPCHHLYGSADQLRLSDRGRTYRTGIDDREGRVDSLRGHQRVCFCAG